MIIAAIKKKSVISSKLPVYKPIINIRLKTLYTRSMFHLQGTHQCQTLMINKFKCQIKKEVEGVEDPKFRKALL